MIVKSIFRHDGRYELGEVEVNLLPGLPFVHIVGLPDASIRECGIKLKSALRARGRQWPRGHQILVNLRSPSGTRRSSAGVELAIALGVLAQTGQLSGELARRVGSGAVVYGELALTGRVFAPEDFGRALWGVEGCADVITGAVEKRVAQAGALA
ncbi:MAG: hypothetical protein HC902_04725 [Calothrix sp. SM1_5_4]|nr:hypothetical protein [Calothrix sp. SM1_5_4]